MNAAIFDYGAGNLHSLAKAISGAGASVAIETDPASVVRADLMVLPGVGGFGPAATRLAAGRDLFRAAIENGKPCLGICLGMQLMFDDSEEGDGAGLGIFRGHVTQLRSGRIPQIGWNQLDAVTDPAAAAAGLDIAYFANGYVCRADEVEIVTAWSEHGGDVFPSIVRRGRVVGTQFHPEKSSAPGLRFIQRFLSECAA